MQGKSCHLYDENGDCERLLITDQCPPSLARGPFGFDEFSLVKKLGGGKTSAVWKAVHKASGTIVALKAYKREGLHPVHAYQCRREIKIHAAGAP